jgi:sialate O-acetylesterase
LGAHHPPASLYNAMVHPFTPMRIRGILWYQGESDVRHNQLYAAKQQALIQSWRGAWGEGDLPFLFVQLTPFAYGGNPHWLPELREAQVQALTLPKTAMVVTTDIGGSLEEDHPRNKQAVAQRLALCALAVAYDREDVEYSGPLYKSMSVEDGAIRIRFDHADGGLASRDREPLSCFQIAGADQVFVDAQVTIDGETVVVGSPQVPQPAAVRFGWDEKAVPNLINRQHLPASPFRTDRWEDPSESAAE